MERKKMIKSKKIIINMLAVMLVFVGVVGLAPKEKVNGDIYYTVNFDVSGGEGSYAPIKVTSGSKITLPSPPKRNHFIFAGHWHLRHSMCDACDCVKNSNLIRRQFLCRSDKAGA
jgi:hypothetical protein